MPACRVLPVCAIAACLAVSGCAQMNHTQEGALVGGGAGAGLGAIIGHQFGHTGVGALIGGLAGTTGGALIGNTQDERDLRNKYAQQAAYERGARIRDQRAMCNRDIVSLTQQGVSDSIIIRMMNTRGTRFDTSSPSIIALQQHGVSDAVLQAMIEHESRQ